MSPSIPTDESETVLDDVSCPRLLVSVRDRREAAAALIAGCDILDIKEPSRGPLGMADLKTIGDIVEYAHGQTANISTSAALGELVEWPDQSDLPRMPAGLEYVKLGPAKLARQTEWGECFRKLTRRFEDRAQRPVNWVAVAYADHQLAQAPPLAAIVDAAITYGCPVLLLDTFSKTERTLLDWITPDAIAGLGEILHANGRMLALAGRLRVSLLPRLIATRPDILAIRSAACFDEMRTHTISATAIRQFRNRMTDAFASVSVHRPGSGSFFGGYLRLPG